MGLFEFFGNNNNNNQGSHQRHYDSPPTPHKDPKYQQPRPRRPMYITVRWGSSEPIDLPLASVNHYRHCTVHDIKLQCKSLFHIPLATMTLKYNGGILKDDQATLESLGILPSSELIVLGDQVLNEQVQQIASGNEEEVGLITRIRQIMKEPDSVASRVANVEQNPPDQDELAYLSEVVMRALLALDGLECAQSFTTARQERRHAVQLCQSLLDRVDALKSTNQQNQKL